VCSVKTIIYTEQNMHATRHWRQFPLRKIRTAFYGDPHFFSQQLTVQLCKTFFLSRLTCLAQKKKYHVSRILWFFHFAVVKMSATRSFRVFWTAFNKQCNLRQTVLTTWLTDWLSTNSTQQTVLSKSRNSQHFMEPEIFIAVFTTARHLSLFWGTQISRSNPAYFYIIQIKIVLPSMPRSLPFRFANRHARSRTHSGSNHWLEIA
jgi:hypothetical protein